MPTLYRTSENRVQSTATDISCRQPVNDTEKWKERQRAGRESERVDLSHWPFQNVQVLLEQKSSFISMLCQSIKTDHYSSLWCVSHRSNDRGQCFISLIWISLSCSHGKACKHTLARFWVRSRRGLLFNYKTRIINVTHYLCISLHTSTHPPLTPFLLAFVLYYFLLPNAHYSVLSSLAHITNLCLRFSCIPAISF